MDCPLKPADIASLRKLIAMLRELEPHLEAAQAAGLPVDEQVARAEHLKGAGTQMLEVYEPMVKKKS